MSSNIFLNIAFVVLAIGVMGLLVYGLVRLEKWAEKKHHPHKENENG